MTTSSIAAKYSPQPVNTSGVSAPAALLVLVVACLLATALYVGKMIDGEFANARARQEYSASMARIERLRADALVFVERKQSEGQDESDTFTVKIEEAVDVPVSAARPAPQTFTFPATGQAAQGRACSITVQAYGDISTEVISMRPRTLTCGGITPDVSGEIRGIDGRVLDAQVVGMPGNGWLAPPVLSLRLLPYTNLRVWLEPGALARVRPQP